MIQEDSHPCQIFIGGEHLHSVLIPSKMLQAGRFQLDGCSATFVIKSQRQTKDEIALDCTIIPAQK